MCGVCQSRPAVLCWIQQNFVVCWIHHGRSVVIWYLILKPHTPILPFFKSLCHEAMRVNCQLLALVSFKICILRTLATVVSRLEMCIRFLCITQLRHLSAPFFWMPLLDLLIPHFDLAQNRASGSQAREAAPQAVSESSEDSRLIKRRRQTAPARLKQWQNQCVVRLRKEIVPQPSKSEDPLPKVSAELVQFLTPRWKTTMQSEPMKRGRQQSRALWSYLNHGCSRITCTPEFRWAGFRLCVL